MSLRNLTSDNVKLSQTLNIESLGVNGDIVSDGYKYNTTSISSFDRGTGSSLPITAKQGRIDFSNIPSIAPSGSLNTTINFTGFTLAAPSSTLVFAFNGNSPLLSVSASSISLSIRELETGSMLLVFTNISDITATSITTLGLSFMIIE